MSSRSDPAKGAVAVTLDVDMHTTGRSFPRGLYVGGTGNIAIVFQDGTDVVLTGVTGGMVHPFEFRQIKTTGTTATGLFALY